MGGVVEITICAGLEKVAERASESMPKWIKNREKTSTGPYRKHRRENGAEKSPTGRLRAPPKEALNRPAVGLQATQEPLWSLMVPKDTAGDRRLPQNVLFFIFVSCNFGCCPVDC